MSIGLNRVGEFLPLRSAPYTADPILTLEDLGFEQPLALTKPAAGPRAIVGRN